MNIRSLYAHRILLALLVASALAVASMTILVIRQQGSQADSQVYLEAGGSGGANPFVPLVIPPATTGGNQGSGSASFQATGSMDNQMACDPEKLVSYLAGNPQASEAWVHALNSDRALSWSGGSRVEIQQIPSYIHELTPRLLADDLRVTNYQFTNGAALAVQSVLEKGTAVLVDAKGVARVRCACGNPLTSMIQLKMPAIYRGTPWPNFRPQRVVLTQRGPQCGDAEYRGDDGRCHGPDHPGPPGIDKHPDPQRWQDEPAQPAQPPYPVQPPYSDKPPYPDKPGRPDEPSPDKPGHPDDSPHSGKPGPDGLQPHSPDRRRPQPDEPHYPDRSSGPEGLKHPDKPAGPDQPDQVGKPASSHQNEPAEDRPVESKAGHNPAQSGAEPEKSAVPNQRGPRHSDPPQDGPVQPVRHDRPDKPAPRDAAGPPDQPASAGNEKPAQSRPTRDGTHE